MRQKKERGAIVVEACLALPIFMFAIITILGLYYVCLAQSRVAVALNDTARELSVYAYLYDLTGLNEAQANAAQKGASASSTLKTQTNNVGQVSLDIESMQKLFSALETLGGDISDNPESYLYYLGNQAAEQAKGYLLNMLVNTMISKHFGGDSADDYLRRLGIEDGIDYSQSTIYADGTDDIYLVAAYKIKIIDLLGIDFSFHIVQQAHTLAWAGGASSATAGTTSTDNDS